MIPRTAILAAFSTLAFSQALVPVPPTTIDLGSIDAANGVVALSWKVRNAGTSDLRLSRVDPECPKTMAEPVKGILRPGETTEITGSFNPRDFSGPTQGNVLLLAEDGSSLTLSFTSIVQADVAFAGPLESSITAIHPRTTVEAKPLTFHLRSGESFDPDDVQIQAPPFAGARIRTEGADLQVTPYIEEALLPPRMKGEALFHIHFRGCQGSLDYPIDLTWERADPLRIRDVGPQTFEVSYEDNRVFTLKRLQVMNGLKYKATRLQGGRALLLTPSTVHARRIHPKPKFAVPAKALPPPPPAVPVAKHHLRPRPKSPVIPKITPEQLGVLIQMETSHPYRSDVLIDRRKKPMEPGA